MQSITGKVNNLPMSPYLNQIKPWVSVICTSYNHESYIAETLQSVVSQSYPNVELIVIDNGSTDRTPDRIRAFLKEHPDVEFIQNTENAGLCQAFNQGLKRAGGRYVIDLAGDDILLPDRIARQVDFFDRLPDSYAVVFSNARYICPGGTLLNYHYPINEKGQAKMKVPSGDVFRHVLESYFICTPTMMMRKEVLDSIGGYDESLWFEDFDFWVRTSRLYQYAYIDEVLTYKRMLADSLSQQVVLTDNRLLQSTLQVCLKAFDQCATADEYQALAGRIRQFVRKCFYAEQFDLALKFGELLRYVEAPGPLTTAILILCRMRLPVNAAYRRYIHWHRQRRTLSLPAKKP
ncbi:hypothetical protein GCM10023187_08930 [Nibrella viscosa]|uniref:Glycosyltransferase 2-like domain-containing protein n=1 Tax=Nibrella viscosa TaxID=1084524 RepID=A0ABP8JZL5_9BACT